jgi:hypothetical protein
MAREKWSVDGWDLTLGPDLDVELRAGLYGTPDPVGNNGTVAGRTGEVWRPKTHGPGRFVLNMVITTVVDRAALEARWDAFLRSVAVVDRLPLWERVLASGEIRRCYGEVVGALAPTPAGQAGMRAAVEVNIPEGYWWSAISYSDAGAAAAGATRTVNLANLAPSTAPMERLTYTIAGPADDARVSDTTHSDLGVTGDWFQYAGTIPAARSLVVNAETWAISGVGGWTPELARLNHKGNRFLTVSAARPGQTPKVTMTAANTAASTRLSVSGRRSFLA